MTKLANFGKKAWSTLNDGLEWCVDHPYVTLVFATEAVYLAGIFVGSKNGVKVGKDMGFTECLNMFNAIDREAAGAMIAQGLANGIVRIN